MEQAATIRDTQHKKTKRIGSTEEFGTYSISVK